MAWLVTGAAGYLGSHLVRQPGAWIALDSLATGRRERIPAGVAFEHVDINDAIALDGVFTRHAIEGVVHLAALKSVPESVADPARYEHVNVEGTRTLLEVMAAHGVDPIVFASSAAVYGPVDPAAGSAIAEGAVLNPVNPYGQTKVTAERLVQDHAHRTGGGCVILRVFNVTGVTDGVDLDAARGGVVHAAVSAAARDHTFDVLGTDYPTPDGTCVRDYVHIQDVARAFELATLRVEQLRGSVLIANIGTGRGTSVLEVTEAVGAATGRPLRMHHQPRRAGDVPVAVANVDLARTALDWEASRGLAQMVASLVSAADKAV